MSVSHHNALCMLRASVYFLPRKTFAKPICSVFCFFFKPCIVYMLVVVFFLACVCALLPVWNHWQDCVLPHPRACASLCIRQIVKHHRVPLMSPKQNAYVNCIYSKWYVQFGVKFMRYFFSAWSFVKGVKIVNEWKIYLLIHRFNHCSARWKKIRKKDHYYWFIPLDNNYWPFDFVLVLNAKPGDPRKSV